MAKRRQPPIPAPHTPDDLAAIGISRSADRIVRPREFQGPQTLSRQKAPVTNVYRAYGWSLWGGAMGRNLFSWFG